MTRYKATRLDGTDFRTGRVLYEVGGTVTHPTPHRDDASGYLSVSTVPTDCTGMSWPCRLFEVEPVDEWTPSNGLSLPNKRACHELRVIRELPATDAFGPNGVAVVALIERVRSLTADELDRLAAARAAARAAAWAAARAAARDAARDAALALTARDLITPDQFDTLTKPWRDVIGATWEDES